MAELVHDGYDDHNESRLMLWGKKTMVYLSEVLKLYKSGEVDSFIKSLSGFDLNEKGLSYSKIETNWKFLGNNSSNGSTVGMLKSGEKGLIERITNGIDAVIEKQKLKYGLVSPKESSSVIKKAFSNYYNNIVEILHGNSDRLNIKDAKEQVILVVNDGSKSNKPTFDVIDKGTGIKGEDFDSTILSLAKGNKLNSDKSYLIGAFGQGGSTSLPFTDSTIIISKCNNRYYFTVIKPVELSDYKNIVYVYLTLENKIIELEDDEPILADYPYLNDFINSDSGTLVRMVETDISKRFRENEVTKPGMLGDYINTELFNVGLPVKIVDNRANYASNIHTQDRYSYGSFLKLQTSKYLQKDYCGTIDIVHNDRSYKIEYFVLLPKEEEKWGSDSECKKVFEQFNVTYDPIIYTVNGQMITSERYTRINNAGLNFLRFRLLVVINLDVLGTEKYKFFTSDRSQIKNTDLTRGFLDKVINALSNVDKLKEMNTIIADKTINSSIDKELLNDVSQEVKNQYSKYLKTGTLIPSSHSHGHHNNPDDEEIYDDTLKSLEITSAKFTFYKDQSITFVVTTGAQKHINEKAMIYMYIDGTTYYDFTKNVMNGRISYTISSGKIKPGTHTVEFEYFKDMKSELKSDKKAFEVLKENSPEKTKKEPDKELDLDIIIKDEATLIFDVSTDPNTKKITVILCFDSDQLRSEVYGLQRSADEIAQIKTKLIKPVALFGLFYRDIYEKMESDDDKNRLFITFIKTSVITNNNILESN